MKLVICLYMKNLFVPRLMVMEVYDDGLEESMKYYHSGADMPFNFKLIFLNRTCGGSCVHALVDSWFQKMPNGGWPNFVVTDLSLNMDIKK